MKVLLVMEYILAKHCILFNLLRELSSVSFLISGANGREISMLFANKGDCQSGNSTDGVAGTTKPGTLPAMDENPFENSGCSGWLQRGGGDGLSKEEAGEVDDFEPEPS